MGVGGVDHSGEVFALKIVRQRIRAAEPAGSDFHIGR